jgi:hypothetical protein
VPFSQRVKEEALVRSRRCCCVCHEFAGVYTNVHHIQQEAKGGGNQLANAIVLCQRCHGEAGHYNTEHPLGNKYSPSELVRHRDEWWEFAARNPATPLPVAPVSVAPTRLDFPTKSGHSHMYELHVNNKSDSILYSVALAVTSREGPEAYAVVFEPIEPDPGPVIQFGAAEGHLGMMCVQTVDTLGQYSWWFLIRQVMPRSQYRIPLTVRALRDTDGAPHAVAMLMSLDTDPSAIVVRPSEITEGWTQYLLRVCVYDEWLWTGFDVGPSETDARDADE